MSIYVTRCGNHTGKNFCKILLPNAIWQFSSMASKTSKIAKVNMHIKVWHSGEWSEQ
jgi:hypothetical protein